MPPDPGAWVAALERDGHAVAEGALDGASASALCAACGVEDGAAGRRNLLRDVPAVRAFAAGEASRRWVVPVLGAGAFCTRAIWFDKTPSANWRVPWHQDTAIAVAARRDLPGFQGWSTKEGVPHVHPPAGVLEGMLTLRWHLDDCGEENGPLRVVPGSHASGRLDDDGVARWRRDRGEAVVTLRRGGLLLMRPLLLHASSPATRPGHRRVLHLEYSASELPGGLEWADRVASA